jgi:ketosteroid isomerase-like protein
VLRTPAGEVPPTGRQVALDYVHVLRIAGGRHVSFDLMFDRLALLEQLGLAEAPVAPGQGR